jgi:hypothetical protein
MLEGVVVIVHKVIVIIGIDEIILLSGKYKFSG